MIYFEEALDEYCNNGNCSMNGLREKKNDDIKNSVEVCQKLQSIEETCTSGTTARKTRRQKNVENLKRFCRL